MSTYSQSVNGLSAANLFTSTKVLKIEDTHSFPGARANAMQTGLAILCQRPDGSTGYYKLDAERSTPSTPVLIPQ